MTTSLWRTTRWLTAVSIVMTSLVAHAQDTAAATKSDDERTTGLPSQIEWKFNFDAGWGVFGFGNSLYQDPKEHVPQGYGDHWFEGYMKPAITGTYGLSNKSEFYGKLSGVGERTYADAPPLVGNAENSFLPEDLYVGWRSGKALGSSENVLDLTVGRLPYTIGHGYLVWDGTAEGGSRGGYWSNARKNWEFGAVGRFKPGNHTFEVFYLRRDFLPERDSDSRFWGANYEYKIGDTTTLGATYLKLWADPQLEPQRNHASVYTARAYTSPISAAKNLSFELEGAVERNHELLHSDAWTAQAAYEFSSIHWKPKLSYRYALFEGDNPATTQNEAFDPLFPGFYDWGTWWQGEIAGEYFLSNSNLISNEVRLHLTPNEHVSGGVIYWNFLADQAGALGPGVTERDLAREVDLYTDWKINKHFTASFVAAFANPRAGVQQATGRTQNFKYGMVFLAYSY